MEIEFNPIAAAVGLLGGAIALYMMSTVPSLGLIWKLLSFIATFIACYFVFSGIANR